MENLWLYMQVSYTTVNLFLFQSIVNYYIIHVLHIKHTCIIFTGHRCDVKGCGYTLVLDGNMKNHRDVCSAVNAGYVEYKGLPGRVRTGCPNTPAFKSQYCALHKPAAIPGDTTSTGDEVGMITGKRETRNCVLYEVCLASGHNNRISFTLSNLKQERNMGTGLIPFYSAAR